MARLPRLAIANQVHHVLQWGHNRTSIFTDDADRFELLHFLGLHARRYQVEIHAWVLLPDHFHLLVTPATIEALPGLMQALGRDYARRYNRRSNRTGTLWAGRYRSSIIEASRYGLPCMVFMDLHPVRNGIVGHPAEYPWSSHRQFAGLPVPAQTLVAVPHEVVWRLGNTPFSREVAYGELVDKGIGSEMVTEIAASVRGGWILGTPGFTDDVQRQTSRRVSKSRPGRPRRIAE
jgi:putative transposase